MDNCQVCTHCLSMRSQDTCKKCTNCKTPVAIVPPQGQSTKETCLQVQMFLDSVESTVCEVSFEKTE